MIYFRTAKIFAKDLLNLLTICQRDKQKSILDLKLIQFDT